MTELKNSFYITPKDIQILNGCAINAARKEHLSIRDSLAKTGNRLSIYEYCEYWQVDPDHVIRYLNQFR